MYENEVKSIFDEENIATQIDINEPICKISAYTNRIYDLVENSSKSWMQIADVLLDAKTHLNKNEIKQFRKSIKFTYSTEQKLIKIAKCDRIKKYKDRLSRIESWGTLYQVTLLDDEQFAEFEKQFLSSSSPQYFKRSDVEKIRNGEKERSSFRLLAKIAIDFKMENRAKIIEIQEEFSSFLEKYKDNPILQCEMMDFEKQINGKIKNEKDRERQKLKKIERRCQKRKIAESVKYFKKTLKFKNTKEVLEAFNIDTVAYYENKIDLNEVIEAFGGEPIRYAEMFDPDNTHTVCQTDCWQGYT